MMVPKRKISYFVNIWRESPDQKTSSNVWRIDLEIQVIDCVCTNGAPAMLGNKSFFFCIVKTGHSVFAGYSLKRGEMGRGSFKISNDFKIVKLTLDILQLQ